MYVLSVKLSNPNHQFESSLTTSCLGLSRIKKVVCLNRADNPPAKIVREYFKPLWLIIPVDFISSANENADRYRTPALEKGLDIIELLADQRRMIATR